MSPDQRRHDGIGFALACVLGSIISTQVGASYAKTLFAWVPPVTAVWLRTGWAAAFLIGLYAFRRRTRRFTTRRPSWREQPREAKLVAIGYGVALIDLLGFDRLVVCEDLVDHSNVGAIVRDAAGLGWDGVLFAPRCADPLYRRAIKTSMGAVFSLPWARLSGWHTGLDQLKAAGFTVVAMALRDDAVTLDELAADLRAHPRRVALVVGTEGAGLSAHWLGQADVVMRIPMGHGVDSLNVAGAAAVACYMLSPDRS